jgi:peptidylamidoglycolate lyase
MTDFKTIVFSAILTTIHFGCNSTDGENGHAINLKQYELVKDWPKLPENFILGNPTGIGLDSQENVFVFHRAYRSWSLFHPIPGSVITTNTILMLSKEDGSILNSWGASVFIMPHGLTVDKQDNIWVTDVGLHQVFKFSHEGELLMQIGEARVAGDDSSHFNRPTDVAVADDGSFYVSDGYRNSRIVKFSASGRYLFEWGKKGKDKGQFNIPHSIDIDKTGNVYVADRENQRIQVFDATGKFLKEIKANNSGSIYALAIDRSSGTLYSAAYTTSYMIEKGSDIIIFDSTGVRISQFGRSTAEQDPALRYHDIAIDKQGNIYTGDINENRILKFRKK